MVLIFQKYILAEKYWKHSFLERTEHITRICDLLMYMTNFMFYGRIKIGNIQRSGEFYRMNDIN